MNKAKWFIHPILVFIFSILAVIASLILYIYWYVEASIGLRAVIEKANLDSEQVFASQTWLVILILSILVGIILIGIFTIFVYNQKTLQLYRLQHNFINNFTHELKTPVTSIKLYLETFQKYDLSRKDQIMYLDYMIHDADRLSNNINRILNLAKIESKTYKGDFVNRSIVAVLEQFLHKNKHIFSGSEIKIHNEANQSYECRLDLTLFEMLLMNLITNAVKYNESATPRVDIILTTKGRELHLDFKDNGVGLPRSEIKKIFRRFYQIGYSDNMSAKGSGLGLYLAENIARLHKGRIQAESPGIGKGSVFNVVLPLDSRRAAV